jgi:type II secretory pathway pseudopilin PulG
MHEIHKEQAGFSLIEAMIAMVVVVISLTGLLGLLAFGVRHQQISREDSIAKEKARECFENIYGARNAGQLSWDQINNVGVNAAGVFVTGFNPLLGPGPDGILGTADDAVPEVYKLPGPDGMMNTSDDVTLSLANFSRQITIAPVITDTTLKQVTVTIRVDSPTGQRDFHVVGLISEYH